MEGSVRKRGSKWYYSFEGALIDGKRKRIEKVGGNTKAEALSSLREAIKRFEEGDVLAPSEISVSDYFDYWFKEYVERNLKPNTQKNYRQIIDKYIKPEIGKYKLKAIGPAKLQETINKYPTYKGSKLAKHTVEIIVTVMSGAFRKAIFPYQLIKDNPMAYVEMPKYKNKEVKKENILKTISMDQYQDILKLIPPADSFYIPLILGFNTGLRRGEVCGLQWQDISFDKKTLTVNRNMQQNKGKFRIETPKTASSYRTILLNDVTIQELRKHKKRQLENRMRYGEHYQQSNFVCTKDDGEPVTPNSVKWKGNFISKKLEFPFHFHMLRHTHATLLLAAGVSMKVVQNRLGHSKITTTMDTYAHVTNEMENEAVEKFDNYVQK